MLDKKGNFYILESLLAVILLIGALMVFNTIISIPNPIYSDDVKDFQNAQDIMEILSGKVNFTERTFIGDISKILEKGKNSKKSADEVSDICSDKFNSLNLNHYSFRENNVIKKTLASSDDYSSADNVSTATRSYGDYSYTLYLW